MSVTRIEGRWETRRGVFVRALFFLPLFFFFFAPSSVGEGAKPAAGQPDISRSGSDFLELCSTIGSESSKNPARIYNDATCLGWVEGFEDGFTVHDELLGVPRKDRMVCMPHGVTTIQAVGIIKKYIANNPKKAHRPTRYIASLAFARAFSCKAGK